MGTRKQLPGESTSGFALAGALDHTGASVTSYIPYVCLVAGDGSEIMPAGNANQWQYAAPAGGVVPSAGQTAMKAAGAAGVKNVIDSIHVAHDVLGAAVELIIQDGSNTIARYKLQTPATEGITIPLPGKLKGTAATALNYTFSGVTTGGVFVNAQGHTET